jgi:hypothetical protein
MNRPIKIHSPIKSSPFHKHALWFRVPSPTETPGTFQTGSHHYVLFLGGHLPRKQSLAAVGLSFPVFWFIDFALGIQTFGVAIDR